MGGPLPAFAGISLANEDNLTNQMPENRWIASMTPRAARKFLVPANEFPVPRKQIPCFSLFSGNSASAGFD
jgi:hypothetical protein